MDTSKSNNKLTKQIQDNFVRKLDNLKNEYGKLNFVKRKRALFNFLGSAIKIIAGNPDSYDLEIIHSNISTLLSNQNEQVFRMNQYTSIAAQLTKSFQNFHDNITQKIQNLSFKLNSAYKDLEQQAYISKLIWYVDEMLEQIKIIERSISLSWKEIPSLELVNLKELQTIQNYLNQTFEENQLLHLNKIHPFEIEHFIKNLIIMQGDYLLNILKIPILKIEKFSYSKIYPIPNPKQIILIPEAQYVLNHEQWIRNECKKADNEYICEDAIQSKCKLSNLSRCEFATIEANYTEVIALHDSLLITTNQPIELIENCSPRIKRKTIRNNAIISSNCSLLINGQIYNLPPTSYNHEYDRKISLVQPPLPKFKLKKIQHLNLEEINKKIEEIEETPLHMSATYHITQTSIVGILTIITISLCVLAFVYRIRLLNLFCRKTVLIKVPKHQTQEAIQVNTLNEDIQT